MSDHMIGCSLLPASWRRCLLVSLAALVSLLAPLPATAHENHAPATWHDAAAVQDFSFVGQLLSSQPGLRPLATWLPGGRDPLPPWSPAEYDGKALTADAPDLTTLPTVHGIYLYPKDGPNRFSQFAAMFQRDARAASRALTTLNGRAIRFDERLGDDQTTRYLDITVVKSRNKAASLHLGVARDELISRGFKKANTKYFVWLDAPSKSFCGTSEVTRDTRRSAANTNDSLTFSAAHRYYDAANPDTGGFCSYRTVLHELAHGMGVVQSTAPHSYGTHCNDHGNDLMCDPLASAIAFSPDGGMYWDYGNDDYWDPAADPDSGSAAKLAWWTMNLSKFLCPTVGCNHPNNPQY